jgi:hypothetical protein
MMWILQVASNQRRLLSGIFDPLLGFACVFILVEIGNEDIHSLAGAGDRNGPSNAAVAAGNDGLPAVSRPEPR